MARIKPASGVLSVWMNGERIGIWSNVSRTHQVFAYDEQWLGSPYCRPLSLSLSFTPGNVPHRGAHVEAYFDNLLPESAELRRRLAAHYETGGTDAFSLLSQIGRDCVGAVQLLPENASPERIQTISAQPLTSRQIVGLLENIPRAGPLGAGFDDDFRISLAGAQEKTALTWHEGRWCLPLGATPTTHLFKLPMGRVGAKQVDFSLSVENEWLCAQLVSALGLPIAPCEIQVFDGVKVLVVTRFDRQLSSNRRWWMRLPQEDFCQALGKPATQKYESEGGPGIPDIMRVLEGSSSRIEDRATFFRAQIIFWLLAAIDGHAKNFSLFIHPQGMYRLTPLYDVLSAFPAVGKKAGQLAYQKLKLAMSVRGKNKHYHLDRIRRHHWDETAKLVRLEGSDAEPHLRYILERTAAAVETVNHRLPQGFPAAVADPILKGFLSSAERLASVMS